MIVCETGFEHRRGGGPHLCVDDRDQVLYSWHTVCVETGQTYTSSLASCTVCVCACVHVCVCACVCVCVCVCVCERERE